MYDTFEFTAAYLNSGSLSKLKKKSLSNDVGKIMANLILGNQNTSHNFFVLSHHIVNTLDIVLITMN